jgi:tRNA A37 threonylcarbamoyladenosine synthetase subunit TsaC/SUA5/YrdC
MIIIPFFDIMAAGNFKKISACLHNDGVIAYPTDTLYGLGGNFFSPVLIEKIDGLKKRHDMP